MNSFVFGVAFTPCVSKVVSSPDHSGEGTAAAIAAVRKPERTLSVAYASRFWLAGGRHRADRKGGAQAGGADRKPADGPGLARNPPR